MIGQVKILVQLAGLVINAHRRLEPHAGLVGNLSSRGCEAAESPCLELFEAVSEEIDRHGQADAGEGAGGVAEDGVVFAAYLRR